MSNLSIRDVAYYYIWNLNEQNDCVQRVSLYEFNVLKSIIAKKYTSYASLYF